MTKEGCKAFMEQRQNQLSKGWRTDVEIDGYSDFVFPQRTEILLCQVQ